MKYLFQPRFFRIYSIVDTVFIIGYMVGLALLFTSAVSTSFWIFVACILGSIFSAFIKVFISWRSHG